MQKFMRSAILLTIWMVAFWIVGNFVGNPVKGLDSLVFNIGLLIIYFLGLTASALIAIIDILERAREITINNFNIIKRY